MEWQNARFALGVRALDAAAIQALPTARSTRRRTGATLSPRDGLLNPNLVRASTGPGRARRRCRSPA
jgi:hypothetical protein